MSEDSNSRYPKMWSHPENTHQGIWFSSCILFAGKSAYEDLLTSDRIDINLMAASMVLTSENPMRVRIVLTGSSHSAPSTMRAYQVTNPDCTFQCANSTNCQTLAQILLDTTLSSSLSLNSGLNLLTGNHLCFSLSPGTG